VTLFEFLDRHLIKRDTGLARNIFLNERGFETLYVRVSFARILNGKRYNDVFDISNIEASVKGKGRFTRMVERVRMRHPKLPIFVENVLNKRFDRKLKELGFTRCREYGSPYCYFLPPNKSLKLSKRST
jgi:hypothetical protein